MTAGFCSVNDCGNKHLARGFCQAHYLRWYKHGRLHLVVRRDIGAVERILLKIKHVNGCWVYAGKLTAKGYAHVQSDTRKMKYAHRIMYEAKHGPVLKGMELDHLCRNRACCNPDHVEAVTHRENMRRSPLVTRRVWR
jgi:hypothetical protein